MCKARGCYYYPVQIMGYHAERTVVLQFTGRIYTAVQVINQSSLPIYYTQATPYPRCTARAVHLQSLEQLQTCPGVRMHGHTLSSDNYE